MTETIDKEKILKEYMDKPDIRMRLDTWYKVHGDPATERLRLVPPIVWDDVLKGYVWVNRRTRRG